MTSPAAVSPLLTAEEYASYIDPPGMVTELVRGRVVAVPQPRTVHGRRAGRISRRLEEFAEQHDLGVVTYEGGYLLARDPDTVRAPDAAFLASHAIPVGGLPEDEWIRGAPTLAVEVVSPGDRPGDVAAKVAEWLAVGAERVWEVRPRTQTVTVHRTGTLPRTLGVDDTLSSDDAAFSAGGFALPLRDIFA